MARRKPKTFPPGTFIPTSQRVMAIIQLCLAFSLLCWYLAQPFMGEYFNLRSRMLIYEYVMKQAERFEKLPASEKQVINNDYEKLKNYSQRPVFDKIENGIRSLIQKVPPFEQAWIFFSLFISIYILLKKEGAKSAAWLLPLIIIAYSIDNQRSGKPSDPHPDYQLFPSEQVIIRDYLKEPFSSSPTSQKEQLEKGWKNYLIEKWSTKSHENKEQQLVEGEFNFTLARLNLLHGQPRNEWLNSYHEKLNPLLILIYFFWNVAFAWIVSRPLKSEVLTVEP